MNNMMKYLKYLIGFAAIALVLLWALNHATRAPDATGTIEYSRFVADVKEGKVKEVEFDGQLLRGRTRKDGQFATISPEDNNSALIGLLLKHAVDISVRPAEERGVFTQILIAWFPMLLFIAVWIYFMRRTSGMGGQGAFSFGKSKARRLGENQVNVTFNDVAGCDEAKQEVAELVEFLRDPSKFQRLGGNIPRGVLMIGPPGTGKTLLARAIAGEAKVPFYTISGSDFVEVYVGVGASRVRDMFKEAKKNSPCIIFIDEIDAVGRQRGAGLGGGHDEREQTLNQLLVEMDGFEGKEGIIVIAATNRPDVLDKALLRPGRFDRHVEVGLPDVRGREQILNVHMRKAPIADDVEASTLARGTPGFSGAELANLVNEAALFAARADKQKVEMTDFEKAKDKIMMGAERRTMVMSDEEKRITAYHEAGHAIVGRLVPSHDPVYKVSIIPRGRALGVTMFLPERDRISASKQALESQIASAMGGRVAEELIFGAQHVTTGASNDIERASQLARNMVTKWGLSERMGPLAYSSEEEQVFLGRAVAQHKSLSNETAYVIDHEVRDLVKRNYGWARELLTANMRILHLMADALMLYETIDSDQIDAIMAGRTPSPPKGWKDEREPGRSTPTGTSPVSDIENGSEPTLGDAAGMH